MTNKTTPPHQSPFEQIKLTDPDSGTEVWSSRRFAEVLGYASYQHFETVIEKAKLSCLNSGHPVDNHFVDGDEMVAIGSSARRSIRTTYMSRYACYLAIQNADPRKKIVAEGQNYFAVQTRRQELGGQEQLLENERRLFLRNQVKQHNSKLANAAMGAGVIEPVDYAIFQNHGYRGLYNGLDQSGIHRKKGLKKSQKILDHMGSSELAANLFRATQAEEKLRRDNIQGKEAANRTHYEVGKKVRQTIKELGGTMPENLPAVESINKLESKKKNKLGGGKAPGLPSPKKAGDSDEK